MRVLIVSDSHGRSHYLEKAILDAYPIDRLIHLGDIEGDEEYVREITPCPVDIVAGNNDFFSFEPKEKVLLLGGHRCFITHGHHHNVYSNTEMLKAAARIQGADIAMYGHTHVPKIDTKDDVWVINPGSISLPRQEGRKPSYIIMEINDSGEVTFDLRYFNHN